MQVIVLVPSHHYWRADCKQGLLIDSVYSTVPLGVIHKPGTCESSGGHAMCLGGVVQGGGAPLSAQEEVRLRLASAGSVYGSGMSQQIHQHVLVEGLSKHQS